MSENLEHQLPPAQASVKLEDSGKVDPGNASISTAEQHTAPASVPAKRPHPEHHDSEDDQEPHHDSATHIDPANLTPHSEATHKHWDSDTDSQNVMPGDFVDYNVIYEGLLAQYAYQHQLSQKLWAAEKTQRQTLYYYKRRNNALLDLLAEFDDEELPENIQSDPANTARLANLAKLRPEIASEINTVLLMSDPDSDPAAALLKKSFAVNLAVDEMIPDIPHDELEPVEQNPQDTDMWTRRNFSHLVVSKFKPAEIKPRGVREYTDSSTSSVKRRKKA